MNRQETVEQLDILAKNLGKSEDRTLLLARSVVLVLVAALETGFLPELARSCNNLAIKV